MKSLLFCVLVAFCILTTTAISQDELDHETMVQAMRTVTSNNSSSLRPQDDPEQVDDIKSLSKLIVEDSDSATTLEAYLSRAEQWKKLNAFDLVAFDLHAVHQLEPSPENLRASLIADIAAEKFDSAIRKLNVAIEQEEQDVQLLIMRAECKLKTDQLDTALSDFQNASTLGQSEDSVQQSCNAGIKAIQARQSQLASTPAKATVAQQLEAIKKLEKQLAFGSSSEQAERLKSELATSVAELYLAMLDEETDNRLDLLEFCQRFNEAQPNSFLAASILAHAFLINDRPERANSVLEQSFTRTENRDSETALLLRAAAFQEFDKLDQSLADMSRALELNPENSKALVDRSFALAKTGQFNRAAEDFQKLISIEHPLGYSQIGISHQELGNETKAITALSKAIRLSGSETPELLISRARSLINLEAKDLVAAQYQKAIEQGYDTLNLRRELADLLRQLKDYEKAIAEYSYLIESGADDATNRMLRGKCYQTLKQFDRAKQDFSSAIASSPPNSSDQNLAELYLDSLEASLSIQSLMEKIRKNDSKELRLEFATPIQSILDEETLAQRIRLINRLTDSYTWQQPAFDSELGAQKVIITADNPLKETLAIYRDSENKLLGVSFASGQFTVDTFDAVNVPNSRNHAETFWRSVCKLDIRRVSELMMHGRKSSLENSIPNEASLKATLAEFDDVALKTLDFHTARILLPKSKNQPTQLGLFHLMGRADDTYINGRIIYELDSTSETFKFQSFNAGKFQDAYCHFDSQPQADFLSAMVSGDPQQVVDLIHPFEQADVNPELLKAFQAALIERFGKFASIEPGELRIQTSYENGERITIANGAARFEKATLSVDIKHVYGFLLSFDFGLENFRWKHLIEDTPTIEKDGADFLRQLIMGSPQETVDSFPSGFDHLTAEKIDAIKQNCLEAIGEIRDIKFQKKSKDAESGGFQFEYLIEGEKKTAPASVTMNINPFGASLFSFEVETEE